MKSSLCTQCNERPAIWALQYVGDDRPTLTTLGSHYRGWRIVARLCSECAEEVTRGVVSQSAVPAHHLLGPGGPASAEGV
jgi:hypothetical protein